MYQPFDLLPDTSRIWLYASSRRFSAAEQLVIREALQDFCGGWATHGKEMPSSFEILHEQVLVMAVDESQLGASGCSIDSSVRALQSLEQTLGVDLVNQGKVTLKDAHGALRVLPALGLKSKISLGETKRMVAFPTENIKIVSSEIILMFSSPRCNARNAMPRWLRTEISSEPKPETR